MRQLMLKKIKGLSVTWFSPGSPVFSTNKTDRNDITEILLKVALKHYKPKPKPSFAKIQIINYVDNLNMLDMQRR